MSRIPEQTMTAKRAAIAWSAWWLLLAGIALLFLPTWWDLANTTWRDEEQSHGPVILLVAAYLAWLRRDALAAVPHRPHPLAGWALLGLGLALYAVGRSQQVIIFETASLIPVLLGILLLAKGGGSMRLLWFPIFFLVFTIPLPGFLVSDATGPLKQSVSAIVDACLYQFGYPIARNGITLTIGQYQLLVADTCSGLNSMIALVATGLLYVHLMWRRGWPGNVLLIAAILPVAYTANVLRVIFLALVTYHFGEAAAQGNLHSIASVALFSSAVVLLIGLDALLMWVFVPPAGKESPPAVVVSPTSAQAPPTRPLRMAGLSMLAVSGLTLALAAQPPGQASPIDLHAMIPERFGDWQLDRRVVNLPQSPELQARIDESYNQTLVRTYVNASGQRLTLVLAYGNSGKVHNPEVCYPGQGFTLVKQQEAFIDTGHQRLPVRHLLAYRGTIPEPVTYWVIVGDQVSRFGAAWRLQQLRYSLLGQVQDSLVFRVSSLAMKPEVAYAAQADFIRSLIANVSAKTRVRLVGDATTDR
jgi:exosortase B